MKKLLISFFCLISLANADKTEIKGQDGRKYVLELPAKKVVIFPMPFTSMYMAIDGGSEHIIGLHADAKKNLHESFLIKAYPEAKKLNAEVAKAGFAPNVEQIIGLKPDVVFQWADQGDAVIEPLRNAGIPVIGFKYGTQKDLEQWIRIMGKVSGKNIKAEKIIQWQQAYQKKFEIEATSAKKIKIISLQYSKNRLRVAGDGSYDDFYIRLIGGVNPAASDIKRFAEVSEEQLIRYNPDMIILGNFDDEKPDEFMKRPFFKNISAVQKKAVYKAPIGGYRWGPPNLESPLMWLWIKQLAYPAHKINLVSEMKKTYRFLYGYEISNGEISQILNLHDNAKSANYHLIKVK